MAAITKILKEVEIEYIITLTKKQQKFEKIELKKLKKKHNSDTQSSSSNEAKDKAKELVKEYRTKREEYFGKSR